MNFNLSKLVDQSYIHSILQKNKSKKLICFGAGTATYLMPLILPDQEIDYYIDSNPRLWGIDQHGNQVKDPHTILKETRGNFIVLIVSQHAISMCKQLEYYGLVKDVDFYDLFTACEMYFRMKKVIFQADKLIEMLQVLPNDIFDKQNSGPKIGVIAACGYMGTPMIYDIGIFLLLNYLGYPAELIMDNTNTCENFTMYDGATVDIKSITDQIIEFILNKFTGLTVKFIPDEQEAFLSIEDYKVIHRQALLNTTWQKSRQNSRSIAFSESDLFSEFYKTFEKNLKNIKLFFNTNHSYQVMTISTGLHYHRGLYTYMGHKYGIRVANYDGANNDGKTSWATDFPNGHHYDIPKIINGGYFEKSVQEWIQQKAEEHFHNRRYAVSDGVTAYNYQLVGNAESSKWYDIIIPLNVMWDAAAIGLNRTFDTEKDWLLDTIDFILSHTNATIIVREHPVQMQLDKYNNGTFEPLLNKHFGLSKRLYFCKYDQKINTYQLIEHCKAVLPLSSTIGVEAALLDRPVITHSNCYYSKLSFVKAASSREEYFSYIQQALEGGWKISPSQRKEALLSYYLLMNSRIMSDFSEANPEWLFSSLGELSQDSSVQAIVDAIVRDIPIPYYNIIQLHETAQ